MSTTSTTADVLPTRASHTAVWSGSKMIVWGGYPWEISTTGWSYDPATDKWTPISAVNAPDHRTNHTAVWTGTEMIIWGGSYSLLNYNTGGRYNPTTDTWTATAATNAPTGRTWHTSVWAGDSSGTGKMIIWSGTETNDLKSVNTGGLYDPSTDTWTATSTTAEGRIYNEAVWTGTEMIVWGGLDSATSTLKTGERYNPNANTWTPLANNYSPTGRYSYTTVWDGEEMIVWGGTTGAGKPYKTGGRYNPTTNAWAATATMGAPDGRSEHTAVWTGSEMIVWGGTVYDEAAGGRMVTNTGGRYNPTSDTWTAMSTDGAPAGRGIHQAVWTGAEMIVWGGAVYDPATGTIVLKTGARYNPTTDTWTAISTDGAPEGRQYFTAVWTGTEMLVWGGSDGISTEFNDGGRYNPTTNTWSPITIADDDTPSARHSHTAVWPIRLDGASMPEMVAQVSVVGL